MSLVGQMGGGTCSNLQFGLQNLKPKNCDSMQADMTKIRLYKYLLEKNKAHKWGYSEAAVKKNITNLGVKIDDNLVFEHLSWVYKQNGGEEKINLDHWPKPEDNQSKLIKPLSQYILYEDDDLVVFDKPKGVSVDRVSG